MKNLYSVSCYWLFLLYLIYLLLFFKSHKYLLSTPLRVSLIISLSDIPRNGILRSWEKGTAVNMTISLLGFSIVKSAIVSKAGDSYSQLLCQLKKQHRYWKLFLQGIENRPTNRHITCTNSLLEAAPNHWKRPGLAQSSEDKKQACLTGQNRVRINLSTNGITIAPKEYDPS